MRYLMLVRNLVAALSVLTASLILSAPAFADEKNLSYQGLAIEGHDPVAYFTENRAVPGDAAFTVTHDGATYRFASAANKSMFEADPDKYIPQYGGFCAYGAAQGYNAPVEPEQFTIADGKLYLNYNADVRKRWDADRAAYIGKADAYWASR